MGSGRTAPAESFPLTNRATRQPVPVALIIPHYELAEGCAIDLGHGPSGMTGYAFLARPFVHRAGAAFRPHDGGGAGVGLITGGAYVGRNYGLTGVIVLAPGYAPRWEWDLYDTEGFYQQIVVGLPPDRCQLDPLPASQAIAALQGFGALLERDTITAEQTGLEIPEGQMYVRFTEEERTLVRNFVSTHARALAAQALTPNR
jgi:hypothetical protein